MSTPPPIGGGALSLVPGGRCQPGGAEQLAGVTTPARIKGDEEIVVYCPGLRETRRWVYSNLEELRAELKAGGHAQTRRICAARWKGAPRPRLLSSSSSGRQPRRYAGSERGASSNSTLMMIVQS